MRVRDSFGSVNSVEGPNRKAALWSTGKVDTGHQMDSGGGEANPGHSEAMPNQGSLSILGLKFRAPPELSFQQSHPQALSLNGLAQF